MEEGIEREKVQGVRGWLSSMAHMDFYWVGLLTKVGSYKRTASENKSINKGGYFNSDRLG